MNAQYKSWVSAYSSYYLHRDIESLGLGFISVFYMFKKLSLGHTLRKSVLHLVEVGRDGGGGSHTVLIPITSPSLHLDSVQEHMKMPSES